jgi:fumarate reductase subunit C
MKYGLPQAVALYLFLFIMPLISGIKIVKTIDSEYEKNILILFCILCFILIIVTLVAPAFHATYIFTGYLSGLGFKVKKRLKVLEFKKRDVSIKTRHNF